MNTKKILLFLIIIVIGISIVSATEGNLSTDDDNLIIESAPTNTITENNNIEDTKTNIKDNNQQIKTINDNTNSQNNENISKTIKQDTTPKTIILNNTNFDEYITDAMFNDKVNPGDTIDIQGYLDGLFHIRVNKALNITSTTNDAYIGHDQRTPNIEEEINPTSGEILRFVILNEGSGTNISNIHFHNVHLYTENFAHDIHINNITMTSNAMVGQGRGMISIREGASNVTINNSYFQTDRNGGHSLVVFHYAQNCIFENNTVVGHDMCGNLVYLTTYGGIEDTGETDVEYGNKNITIRYNLINGMDISDFWAICYPFVYEGANITFENNTVLRPQRGIILQVNDYGTHATNTTIRNNYMPYVERDYITDKNLNDYGTLDSNGIYTLSNNTYNKAFIITAENISTVINNYGAGIHALSPNIYTLISNVTKENYQFERLYAPNTTVIVNHPVTIINSTVKQLILHNSSNVTNNIIITDENQTIISDYSSNDTKIWENYLISGRNNSIRYGNQTISILNGTLSNNGPNLNNIHVLTNENYYTLFNEDYTLKDGITGTIMAVDNITNPVIINNEVTLETALNTYTNYSIFANLTYNLNFMNTSNVVMEDFFGHYTYYHYNNINCYQMIDGPVYTYSNITFINGSQNSKVNNILAKNIKVNTDNINVINSSFYENITLNNSKNTIIENNQLFGDHSTINMINSTENTIKDNLIHNQDEYTIILDENSQQNTLTDNNLESKQVTDNQTILNGGIDTIIYTQENMIEHNTPYRNVTITIDSDDEVVYKQKNNLTVTITYDDQPVTQGQVVCLYNGTQIFKENLTNGTVTATFTPQYIGTNDIKIWYISPGDTYNTIGAYKKVLARTFNTTLTLEADTTKVGENITVKATLLDEFNQTLDNQTITFKIGENEYNYTTAEGTVIFNATTNESWYNTGVQANFQQTDSYNQSTSNKIKLEKGDVLFDIRQRIVDDKLVVTISVTDINGVPVSSGRIRFRGNASSSPQIVDGSASLELPLANVTGGMTVTANFTNNNAFNNKIETIMLSLNPPATTILNMDDVTGKINEPATITATVTTDDGLPVNEGTVTFTMTGYNETVDVVDGTATTTHTFTEALDDTITATYNPLNPANYTSSNGTATIVITGNGYTLKVDTITFTAGQTATIAASIYEGNSIANTINKGKVTFKINGKTLKDSNAKVIYVKIVDGIATIEDYEVPQEWAKEGSTIQAIYSGSSDCPSLKSAKENINISKETPTVIIDDVTAMLGQTIRINIHVMLGQNLVNTGKVIVKINGKTVKDVNGRVVFAKVVNNTVTLQYTIPSNMKAGTHTITAVYTSLDYDKIESTSSLIITNKQVETNNYQTTDKNTRKDLKQDTTPKTIILNSTTFDEYVTNRTFNDNVNPGDTIDIQGLLDGEHFNLDIYKPLNIISSTHDAYITNIMDSGRNEFIIYEGASGTNITGISFHNTYIGIHSAHNITFDNITATHNKGVGQGTGMFSVRSYSSNVIIKNSYFEGRDNGGHSVFVFHYAQNCLVENTTIKGSGNIGNLVYLTTYGGRPDNPAFGDNSTAPQEIVWDGNYNITFRNNFIFGSECASAICYILAIEGSSHLFDNNTIISTTGNTVKKQWNADDIYLRNITFLNNILTDVSDNLTEHENITFINNTIISEELLVIDDDNYNEYGYVNNDILYIDLITDKAVRLQVSGISEVTLLHNLDVRRIHNGISKVNFQAETFNLKYLQAPNTIINCTGVGNISFSNIKALIINKDGCNITDNRILNYNATVEGYEELGDKAVILNNITNKTNCSNNYIVSVNDTNYALNQRLTPGLNQTCANYAIYSTGDSAIMENNVPDSVNITVETTPKLLLMGSNVKINVTYYNQQVTDGYVVVLLNGIPVTKENLTNGVLETVVTPKYIGNQILSVWYSIEGTYNYNNTELLEIEAIQFNTSVMLESNSVKVGEDISVKAIVVDQFDNTVNNGTLTFKVGQDEFNVTIIDGTAVFNATTNETWYTSGVQAILYQTDAYTQSISNKLTLEKGDALFDIRQRIVDDKLVVTISVTDINGVPVSSGRIRFRGNASSSPQIVDGSASLELPLANVTEGMTVTANFTNNNAFNNKIETITLSLNPPATTIISINEVTGKINEPTTITAMVTTDDGLPVNEGSVIFTTNDYNETVDVTDGVATTTHIFTQPLDDIITAMYVPLNSANYTSSNATATIVITGNEYALKVDTITFTSGQTATIAASIYEGNSIAGNINRGKVTFKVNGKTLKDSNAKVIYAKVINGRAIIEDYYIPDSWNDNSVIQAVYSGSGDCDSLKSDKVLLTILKDTPTIMVDNITATAGSTVVLTARISDVAGNGVNGGKVVFKINGKSVKDVNAKVIFAKVTDGFVSIEYVLPESLKAKNYTLTAVYTSVSNEKLEATAALSVVA